MFPASTRAVFSSPKEDTNIILRLTAGQCAVPLTVGPGGSASHVASAFATHSGLTLAQRVVADKSGETEILLPLPEGLDPAPTLISLDALYARKSIAQSLVGNGADDLVALRKNNKRDHQQVQQVVAQFARTTFGKIPDDPPVMDTFEETHRRLTRRRAFVTAGPGMIESLEGWPGLTHVIAVESITSQNTAHGGGRGKQNRISDTS